MTKIENKKLIQKYIKQGLRHSEIVNKGLPRETVRYWWNAHYYPDVHKKRIRKIGELNKKRYERNTHNK